MLLFIEAFHYKMKLHVKEIAATSCLQLLSNLVCQLSLLSKQDEKSKYREYRESKHRRKKQDTTVLTSSLSRADQCVYTECHAQTPHYSVRVSLTLTVHEQKPYNYQQSL